MISLSSQNIAILQSRMSTLNVNLTITFRGAQYSLSLLPDASLSKLQAQLQELTGVPPPLQKLLCKGKNILGSDPQERTLGQAGLKNDSKIQMLGSTSQELTSLHSAESQMRKTERILRERALKAPVKLRSTGSPKTGSLSYRFHQLAPLAHLPNPDIALALLNRLSEDPGIQHIMQEHQFSVGTLTELAPHEHPKLLGLNVNGGEAIKLRLRTDTYDGFRLYNDIRRVLCHELSHNVWREHDDKFKELNSKLNREVAAFERAAQQGTYTLSGDGEVYQPSSELEAEACTHVLGSVDLSESTKTSDESQEERRQRIINATMARLRKEDEETEKSCGTKQ